MFFESVSSTGRSLPLSRDFGDGVTQAAAPRITPTVIVAMISHRFRSAGGDPEVEAEKAIL